MARLVYETDEERREGRLTAQRRYREKNREALREWNREYARQRREDPAVRAAQADMTQRYREADPERWRDIQRRSYVANAEKRRAEASAYRAAHPEKVAAAVKAWVEKNYDRALSHSAKRRALIRQAPEVAFIDRGLIYERDGGICHICRRRVARTKFHLDHLIPLSKGGSHIPENVAVAHPRCNLQRSDGRLPAQLRLVG